jgi:hypothetical protein
MTFQEKCNFAIKELENAKIWKSNYNPPLIKILHTLGFEVPFPHYNTFLSNALITGSFFGIGWGLIMYFMFWSKQNMPFIAIVAGCIFAGVFFGSSMAMYYKHGFKKYKLTPWQEIKSA